MISWKGVARAPACIVLLVLGGVLAACSIATATPKPLPPTPASTPTATARPVRQLTVCLGQEPSSLYWYGNLSAAAKSVLAAVLPAPIESASYGDQPALLTRVPSLANGDVQLNSKSVSVGDEVVGADGLPSTLAPGVKVRPSGCRSDGCAVVYDGKAEIQMDQMTVTFRLLPGLTWSDGKPLTAEDSLYSYQVASDPKTPGPRTLLERTTSYTVLDATTVQWLGKPGYIDPGYLDDFWAPLPQHLWGQFPVSQLPATEEAAREPLGWGPYVIQEWVPGDHITLKKNLDYLHADQGLPKFDLLIFRFTPDPAQAIQALLSGQCDLLDPSIPLDGQVSLLRSMSNQGQLQAYFAPTPVMEQLAFGVRPAAADAGQVSGAGRPSLLGDPRLRQAVAMCLDRQQVVASVLSGLSSVPDTYLPSRDPLYNPDVTKYSFNTSAAGQLLDQIGWRRAGGDPSAPRQAVGVAGVPDGTPLELSYLTTDATQRQQVSRILAGSLAQCGIQVDLHYLDAAALYAPGPDGPLFGRAFDLAELAIANPGLETPCDWFTSSEIPAAANHWVGANISGYSNPAFDTACLSARDTLPGESAHADAYHQAEAIFAQDLPVLPLYWRVQVAAGRKDLCNFSLDPTASSSLTTIENLEVGSPCSP